MSWTSDYPDYYGLKIYPVIMMWYAYEYNFSSDLITFHFPSQVKEKDQACWDRLVLDWMAGLIDLLVGLFVLCSHLLNRLIELT